MFNNQTIVITGGASGIGLEVANAVVQNNGTALIIDNNNETLGKLKKEDNFYTFQADVTDENQLKKVLLKYKDELPKISGLVCSAGKAPIPKKIEVSGIKRRLDNKIDVNITKILDKKIISPEKPKI